MIINWINVDVFVMLIVVGGCVVVFIGKDGVVVFN